VAVTISEWLGIVTGCADPAMAEALAPTVTAEVAYETLISIAVRFPIESSRTLARVLSQGHVTSPTDLHIAQLTIADVINSQPSIVDDPVKAGNQIASIVISNQARRFASAAPHQRTNAADERERTERQIAISHALAKREKEARELPEAQAIFENRLSLQPR
jgi:hypothetical protein